MYFFDGVYNNIVDMMQQIKGFVSCKSYEYTPLQAEEGQPRNEATFQSRPVAKRRRFVLIGAIAVLTVAAVLIFIHGPSRRARPLSCDTPQAGFQCQVHTSHSWGQYSPFYTVPSSMDANIPTGCHVTFAQVLSRHGARDPTASKTVVYSELIDRIHRDVTHYGENYGFIKDYEYTLGADQLTQFGRQQLINSGINFYRRYQLLASHKSPFVRASGQERVVESAEKWAKGFHQTRLRDDKAKTGDKFPYDILVLPETPNSNNTLSDDLCTSFRSGPDPSDEAQSAWLDIFASPMLERLRLALPGVEFSTEDVLHLMEICPFETVANEEGDLSQFCDLFSREEWADYEYYQTLGKWYGYGNGHPLGATRGVGFVNELIARLTAQPVEDHTSTNSTLDGSASTFPLDRALYADFSHDNDMASIFAAMGFYNETTSLPYHSRQSPEETNGYLASWSVPFASRMYVEKLQCDGDEEESVRVLVNDRVMSLQRCGMDDLGRCKLSRFVDSLSFARAGGHWDSCFL